MKRASTKKPSPAKGKKPSSADADQTPPDALAYCTFRCPHSDFPPADAAGICRTMAAVYCKKLKTLVDKNTPCRWRKNSKVRG